MGLHNFEAIVADRGFAAAVRNIALFTLLAVPLELIVGFGLAYLLRRPFRGRTAVRLLLLLPWLVSPVASGVMWRFLFGSETGFLNFAVRSLGLPGLPSPLSQHGLALLTVVAVESWRVAPFVTFLLLPGLSTISRERWEEPSSMDSRHWARSVMSPCRRWGHSSWR